MSSPPRVHLVAVLVHRQVADDERGLLARRDRAGAAQQGAQAGDDLLEAERLGHVVVATGGQAGDPVLDRVLGGEEQHGDVRVGGADAAEHVDAGQVGEHDVEHDDVGVERLGGADGGVAGQRVVHLPALVAQGGGQQLGEGRLVVDHERADRGAVGAGQNLRAAGGGRCHDPTLGPVPDVRLERTCELPEVGCGCAAGRRQQRRREDRLDGELRGGRQVDAVVEQPLHLQAVHDADDRAGGAVGDVSSGRPRRRPRRSPRRISPRRMVNRSVTQPRAGWSSVTDSLGHDSR